jgi:hypothetical protein
MERGSRAGWSATAGGGEPGQAERGGIPVAVGYDGPGQNRVRFIKHLQSPP